MSLSIVQKIIGSVVLAHAYSPAGKFNGTNSYRCLLLSLCVSACVCQCCFGEWNSTQRIRLRRKGQCVVIECTFINYQRGEHTLANRPFEYFLFVIAIYRTTFSHHKNTKLTHSHRLVSTCTRCAHAYCGEL